MPAWDVMNRHAARIPHCFAEANKVSFHWAEAAVRACEVLAVPEGGSVGCLDRSTSVVVGFSSRVLRCLQRTARWQDRVEDVMANCLREVRFQARELVFETGVHPAIRRAMRQTQSTAVCAEKYLHSLQGYSPILGMTVLWYGGADGRYVPRSYESVSGDGFQFMLPCDECRAISLTMRAVAERGFGDPPPPRPEPRIPRPGSAAYDQEFPALGRG